jgi:hypothetical protein
MSFIEQLAQQAGQQIAGGAIGGGMGLLFGKAQDKRQLKQAGKLQALEMAGQRQMAHFNYGQQMKMWEDTNYKAQMAQLEKAGLNPGLIYGMGGGGGGTTQAATGNVSGQSAPGGSGEAVQLASQGMGIGMAAAQQELIRAQKENVEADTQNKLAENPNIPKKGAETVARTGNIQADTALKELDKKFQEATMNDRIDTVEYEMELKKFTQAIAEQQEGILKDQRPILLREAAAKAIGAELSNALTKEQTNLSREQQNAIKQQIKQSQAQIAKWIQEIEQGWFSMTIQDQNAAINNLLQQLKVKEFEWQKKVDIGNGVGNILKMIRGGK